ncbi:hypothetical protein H6G81_07775 [Scytonema hofmannii FACHB-248]|uniref:Uncharacterized protein n=1 Tax=Scytonema hofmannii FACHB-248 TaxID=1842502 RepID=A0ABR8GNB3_9CYAN|nr:MULTISPECIES: hypothetical protein [Nostocales]MBD2604431.1 hypothetical protein [Scytonema hofmannii FACHB-248]
MLEYPSISKLNPEFPNYLNFQTLRDIGIAHLQALSGKLWTDYNLHDPGVTILEVLCYAVTDLGYRNNLDIQDLLTSNPADSHRRENNFFTPDEILTCNPVTELDLRKRLIDIPGVRNARLEKLTTYNPAIYVDYTSSHLQSTPPAADNAPRLHPRGLYTVYIDLDVGYRKNACGQISRSWSDTLDQVKAVLCNYRNLCEDVHDIVVLGKEEIALCADIELEADADAEDVLVEVYVKLYAFISPRLHFYTLEELLDKGKSPAEIFAGRPAVLHNEPYDSHGFIDTAELEALTQPEVIHTSDLYQEILKVPGVAAVRKLSIINYINGLPQSQHPWYLQLTKGYSPVVGVESSKVKLFKGTLPISTNVDEVKRRYNEQQAANIKAFREDYELDLSVPKGSYYNLADHYSIQHDFPLTYGISEDGLPETASELRKAQAHQLKGYLVFFDQLLANYLSQLAHVRELFSWEIDEVNGKWHTYFTEMLDFPESSAIIGDGQQYLNSIIEDPETSRDRRNRFLDHLLGRFAESFGDYVLLNYRMDKVKHKTEIIHDKAHFLHDYPSLSRDRFRAFNYCNCKAVWDTENVSGFKKRVSRLLGIEDVRRRNLSHYRIAPGGWIISLSGSSDDILLESSQTYATQEEAQAAMEKLLLFALHTDFYKRLCDRYDDGINKLTTYGYVLVDNEGKVLAESTERFPTEQEREIALQRWLGIVDQSGNLLAMSATQSNHFGTFKLLNSVEPFLRIEAVTETTSGDRFRLVDYNGVTLLESTQLFDNESAAGDRFYHDLLGILEPGAIYPTATPDGFGFRVLSRPPDQKSEVAIHPQIYRTAAERDAVINRLFLLIRTTRLSINIQQQYNIGQIYGEDEQILLQSKQYYDNIQDAWQNGNILIELAQNSGNFRLITAENGLFGWALTNKDKQPILATQYYSSEAKQKQGIEALQTRINDEGFHILEHILLRPKTVSDNFLPIFVNANDTTTKTGEQKNLTYQDPYSFWITVILPYWTERFRNIDFRRFVERTLRLEAPAHLALKIAWLDVRQMSEFEVAYHDWLEQLALDACDGGACDLTGTLNRLLAIIPQLRSVYPKGILYDSQANIPENQPIILNQTALGTANE